MNIFIFCGSFKLCNTKGSGWAHGGEGAAFSVQKGKTHHHQNNPSRNPNMLKKGERGPRGGTVRAFYFKG